MRVVFVHGACVRDGAWWWHPTAAALRERGIQSVAPALPSCGEGDRPAGPQGPGLAEDVASVRAALTATDEPTVLVGHSYGGIVAAEAAAGVASVRHLVFVSSYLAEPGESLSTFGSETPPPFLDFDPDGGTFGAVPELFGETFVPDCPPEIVRDGATRLVRQTITVLQQPVRAAGWHDVPTTYVVCADDRGTPASAQREFARRADKVVELPTGHHPFLSRPELVADLVANL
ncbi:alpha/beta hydrolase [Cryptosporangium arvum]|uniref:Putative hydrolase or acyltransferase of alpha/beta superfamily n=1 Tax=Cryptosporangium arvum DSM 44712 TaxID=927661 RepID=A0A011AGJ5_9ACTN|nr:alpha/beta hydrolase [Cryptosporangium arvum]EXG81136.1 putative hydrolase or acyltransferase of alpha/beta superfamily [Cryptosporangium arvum DSM 44712]